MNVTPPCSPSLSSSYSSLKSNLYLSEDSTPRLTENISFFDKIEDRLTRYESVDSFMKEQFDIGDSIFLRVSRLEFCQQTIRNELNRKITSEDFEKIQDICKPPAFLGDCSKRLLGYAEYVRRKGREDAAKAIEECVCKSALTSILVKEKAEITPEILEECFKKIKELREDTVELGSCSKQEIPAFHIHNLLKSFLPKTTSSFMIRVEADGLLRAIQDFWEEMLYNSGNTCVVESPSFFTYVKVSEEEVSLLCYPKNMEKEYGVSYSTFDLCIPKDSGYATIEPRAIELSKVEERELENYKLVSQLPLAEQWITPISSLKMNGAFFLKKEPGYQNLQKALTGSDSLSTLDLLHICRDVASGLRMLAASDLLYVHIHPQSIAFQKVGDKIKGKLDHLLHLRSLSARDEDPYHKSLDKKRLNVLAQNGYPSLDTDCYGLILFIAELFFLNLETNLNLNVSEWETQVIERSKNQLSSAQYKEVLSYKNLHGGINAAFLTAIFLNLAVFKKGIETPDEIKALKQFILKIDLFLTVKPLLIEALQVDAAHKEYLAQGMSPEEILRSGPRMPSLEHIQEKLAAIQEFL